MSHQKFITSISYMITAAHNCDNAGNQAAADFVLGQIFLMLGAYLHPKPVDAPPPQHKPGSKIVSLFKRNGDDKPAA